METKYKLEQRVAFKNGLEGEVVAIWFRKGRPLPEYEIRYFDANAVVHDFWVSEDELEKPEK